MAKVTPITEHFQHFVSERKEGFWGDLQGEVQRSMRRPFERLSERQRDLYMVSPRHSRQRPRQDYRNGYYERDFVTRFGTLRLRIARTRKRGFLPSGLQKFQRRAEEVSLLIREAFLRGISTRQVGRLVAILTGEPVSPQTVSRLTRELDEAVRQSHQAPLADQWAYLFLDGVSLRMRRPSGRQRVHMLVAYGVRRDGTRQLLAFMRSSGESQSAWEGLFAGSVPPRVGGREPAANRHRRLCGAGGSHRDRLSPGTASALLGAQDAQHSGESTPPRPRRGQGRCPGDLSRRQPSPSRRRVSRLSPPLAVRCMGRWCGNWSAICRSCWRSSAFPGICGGSCAPPTSSSAASWRCAAAPGPWSAS